MKIQIAEMRSENERNRREDAVTTAKAKAPEQQVDPAMTVEMAALKAQVAELQAPTAHSATYVLYTTRLLRALCSFSPPTRTPAPLHHLHTLQAKEQQAKEREELKQELKLEIKAEQAGRATLRIPSATSAPSAPSASFAPSATSAPYTSAPSTQSMCLLQPCTTCVLRRS